ncbi:MAG: LptF/LptG family permease [Pseudomonadota bacterium]
MRFSYTFSFYVVRSLVINLLYVFFAFSFIAFILDFLELMRDSQGKHLLIRQMLQIVFFKVPFITYSFIPFVFLFGSILTFTKLNNSFELAAANSAGISIWSLCIPISLTVFAISILILSVFQPISASFLNKNGLLVSKYLGHKTSRVSIQSNGIWLYDQTNNPQNDKIIKIMHIAKDEKLFSGILVFSAGEDNSFTTSFRASSSSIENGYLLLSDAEKFTPGKEPEKYNIISLPTNLTNDQIQESIPNPDIIQFWHLRSFIKNIKQSGLSALKHELYYKSMLASPLLYLSLVFIALVSSINLPRKGKLGIVFLVAGLIGIMVFFINKVI